MPLLCYCFWPSLRASSILLCQQFLTWFMHAILRLFCAHDIVFSQFRPSLSLSSSLYLPAVMCCNYITKSFSTELLGSRWQILGIGGGEDTWLGFRKGRLMVCSTNLQTCLQGIQPPFATLALPIKLYSIEGTLQVQWHYKN